MREWMRLGEYWVPSTIGYKYVFKINSSIHVSGRKMKLKIYRVTEGTTVDRDMLYVVYNFLHIRDRACSKGMSWGKVNKNGKGVDYDRVVSVRMGLYIWRVDGGENSANYN